MSFIQRRIIIFSAFFFAIILIGFAQSWNVALGIFNLCLISATMALGVNIQLGYAGIFNAGVMGFAALGGLAAVLISYPPVPETISLGGAGILLSAIIIAITTLASIFVSRSYLSKLYKRTTIFAFILISLFLINIYGSPAVEKIESFEPAASGFLGGFGLPIIFSWVMRIFFAYSQQISRNSRKHYTRRKACF